MGVSCVLSIPITEGKSAKQVLDRYQKKLEQAAAEKLPSWTLDCETYQSVSSSHSQDVKLIHLLHMSECPELSFSVLENNLCMVSEVGFDSIISKLKAFYTPRKGGKIEVKGVKYKLADFFVKFGNITQVSNFRGLALEVEYRPCFEPLHCWNLLGEFVSTYLDSSLHMPQPPQVLVDKETCLFTEADTVLQYLPFLLMSSKKT